MSSAGTKTCFSCAPRLFSPSSTSPGWRTRIAYRVGRPHSLISTPSRHSCPARSDTPDLSSSSWCASISSSDSGTRPLPIGCRTIRISASPDSGSAPAIIISKPWNVSRPATSHVSARHHCRHAVSRIRLRSTSFSSPLAFITWPCIWIPRGPTTLICVVRFACRAYGLSRTSMCARSRITRRLTRSSASAEVVGATRSCSSLLRRAASYIRRPSCGPCRAVSICRANQVRIPISSPLRTGHTAGADHPGPERWPPRVSLGRHQPSAGRAT